MTMIYLLIIFSPLTSRALQTKQTGHAVTECSGDCKTDGCSLERSAAHECCCWKKKQQGSLDSHRHSESHPAHSAHAQPDNSPKTHSACCEKPAEETHDDDAALDSEPVSPSHEERTTTIASGTCGNGSLFIFLNFENSYHLPCFFSGVITAPEKTIPLSAGPNPMTSRFIDPPDHPPQVRPFS
jgi:hypothetical protein